MSKEKKQWIWKCPISGCTSRGIKPQTRRRARTNGLTHISNYHKPGEAEPIIEKMERIPVTTAFRKAVWVCPVKGCHCHGRKPMKRSRSLYHGRKHMQKFHNLNKEPDVLLFTREDSKEKIKRKVKKALIKKGIDEEKIDLTQIHIKTRGTR